MSGLCSPEPVRDPVELGNEAVVVWPDVSRANDARFVGDSAAAVGSLCRREPVEADLPVRSFLLLPERFRPLFGLKR